MRGEYHYICQTRTKRWGSPPLARGIQLWRQPSNLESGITPACAGNTQPLHNPSDIYRDHPRLRGEYVPCSSLKSFVRGSPPLARGIQVSIMEKVLVEWITPACAGNTKDLKLDKRQMRDHPRLRGEYSYWRRSEDELEGSPPLARGIQNFELNPERKLGITPACAGNTQTHNTQPSPHWDHPRLRGEYRTLA